MCRVRSELQAAEPFVRRTRSLRKSNSPRKLLTSTFSTNAQMQKIPQSTYRLQLHSGFTFDDALAAVDYLNALGISHAYCSPYLQAAPNSMHGYNVVDYEKVNVELGGEEGLQRFSARLKALDMGQIL